MKSGQYKLLLNRHLHKPDLCTQNPFCPVFEVLTIGFNLHSALANKMKFDRICFAALKSCFLSTVARRRG
jgi:hypothetical protein